MANSLSKETLDLVSALRPFTGERGRDVIDTLISLAESSASLADGVELAALAEQAKNLLASRVDSAFSLFIILVVLWLVQAFTMSSGSDPVSHS
ncbi:MAG: hypothetical protein WBL52_01185 [Bacillota bacterium]|nr:hypothetical protein [Candidatus Fermentithermobacillaceae bacterium]HAF67237.1 hypothetical protein [Clostridiales bacterium UBA9857]HOA70998.1 hypothetical protein [Bacillota bacterium]HOP70390.1 hypothetical protein [Bacillota bacterium]HPT36344.1 hypothetical protein [Bacillota bacterium]